MATQILQAHVGAGKTEAVLQALSNVINDPSYPFARVWVLLASGRQEIHFRQRLARLPDARTVYFNTEVLNFPTLYDRLLKFTHQPKQTINATARIALLRSIIADLHQRHQLQTFASIADSDGLTHLIAELITELKQNLITPQYFSQQARTPKDDDIALIYTTYHNALIVHDLVDAEGEAWLTLETLQQSPVLPTRVDLLIVDGFDQFSEVQAHILAALSTHIDRTLITLTTLTGREQNIGRRFQRALERLQQAHQAHNVPLTIHNLPLQTNRHPDLYTLTRDIFDLNATHHQPQSSDSIRFLAAPEPDQEAALVLRDVKQRLLTGTPPDEILIALRDWQSYHTHFHVDSQAYGLPVLLHYDQPLTDNPALAILLKALQLAPNDDESQGFLPRDVFQVLRSPYVILPDVDETLLQYLEQITRQGQVITGRQAWFDWLDSHMNTLPPLPENDDEDTLIYPLADPHLASRASLALQTLFDALTMPDQAPLSDYITRLEQLIGIDPLTDPDDTLAEEDNPFDWSPDEAFTLDMVRAIRRPTTDPILKSLVARDIHALQAFKDILRAYLANAQLFQNVWHTPDTVTWQRLLQDILHSIRNHRAPTTNPARDGRILITTATNARGLPHDHVYIVGLSEGSFPAPLKEDPLYLDSERYTLRQRGITLPTRDEKTDDAGLFYELISLARQSLTLSRPTLDDGKPRNESYLWRITRQTFAPGSLNERYLKIGELPTPHEVASLDEAWLTLTDQINPTPDAQNLYAWLMAHPQRQTTWHAITQASITEQNRLTPVPYDPYTGMFQQPDLRRKIHDDLRDEHRWSASQFNQVGACAYQFFASRLLNLKPLTEPEEGFDNLQYGTLMHAILERIYAQCRAENIAIHPDNLAVASDIAHDQTDNILTQLPATIGVTITPQWQHEQHTIRRQIDELIALDFSTQSPLYHPTEERYIEAIEQAIHLTLHLQGWSYPVRVRGYIDRIDRIQNRLYVIDYKTGTPPPLSALSQGRNFQMFVYIRALQTLLHQRNSPTQVAGGYFWSLKGAPHFTLYDPQHEAFNHAEAHLTHYLTQLHDANFSVAPSQRKNHRCSPYCDFAQLCRLMNIHPHKPPAYGEHHE